MEHLPLLAHLAGRFVSQRENLATEALVYILGRSEVSRRTLIGVFNRLGANLPYDLLFRTQATAADGAIPDVVGEESTQRQRLTIEAKFWAALTAAQPTGYVRRIMQTGGGTLGFLVPDQRSQLIWHELLLRCLNEGLSVKDDSDGSNSYRSAVIGGSVTLYVITWTPLLAEMLAAADAAGERELASDIRQLLGLCAREDAEAFLPFASEELTSSLFPKRILQVSDMVDELTARLVQLGVASVKGLKAQGSKGWYGKYLRIGGYGCLLHFSAHKWGSKAFTPMWLQVLGLNFRRDPAVANHLMPRCAAANIPAHESRGAFEIPILLPANAERDRVFADALQQLQQVALWLDELGGGAELVMEEAEPPTDLDVE